MLGQALCERNQKMKRTRRKGARFGGINAEKTPWLFVSLVAFPKDALEKYKGLHSSEKSCHSEEP